MDAVFAALNGDADAAADAQANGLDHDEEDRAGTAAGMHACMSACYRSHVYVRHMRLLTIVRTCGCCTLQVHVQQYTFASIQVHSSALHCPVCWACFTCGAALHIVMSLRQCVITAN